MDKKAIRLGSWEFLGLLILASVLIHFLFIFFFPAGHLLRTELFGGVPEPAAISTPIIFEFVEAGDEVDELAKKEELWKEEQEAAKEEEEKQEEEVEEKKRQQFMDTADSAVDEEVEVETEKIGEKSTLAKDTAPDEGPETEEPKLEGDTEIPAIGGPPGEGPLNTGGIAEILAGIFDEEVLTEEEETTAEAEETETEVEGTDTGELTEVVEETEDTESTTEDDELLAEAELEEASPEDTEPDETSSPEEVTTEVATRDEPATETRAEEPEDTEVSEEKGAYLKKKLGLLDKEFEKEEDGLLPVEEKPKELAYIPPEEPRKQKQEVKKPPKKQNKKKRRSSRKGVRPKVAISFNAKTLAGGTIEPLYEHEDGNVTRDGLEAFTVMKDQYAPYYRHIRDRVSWYWILKYGTRAEIKLETKPNHPIIIQFKVLPNGTTGEVKVIDAAENNLLASYIRDSITETHLNEFPSYVEEEFIDVRFNFYFF